MVLSHQGEISRHLTAARPIPSGAGAPGPARGGVAVRVDDGGIGAGTIWGAAAAGRGGPIPAWPAKAARSSQFHRIFAMSATRTAARISPVIARGRLPATVFDREGGPET